MTRSQVSPLTLSITITWLLYPAVAAASRRWRRSEVPWTWTLWAALSGLEIVIALAIEGRALSSGRWSYNTSAPLFPGTNLSIVPVLQLVLLTPLVFRLSDRLSRAGMRGSAGSQ
ncbi:MAG: hypothetical protein ABIT01_18235 [Thermoanaerobaculia bacterium]